MKKKKTEWLGFNWPGVYPIQCSPSQKAWVFDFPKYGFKFSKMAMTFENDTTSYYFIKKEYIELGKKFFRQIYKEPQLILKVLDEVNKTADKIFKLEKSWTTIDFSKKNDQQLLKYHKQLFSLDEVLWRKGQLQNLLEMQNNYVTTFIRERLKSIFGPKKEIEYFQIISTHRYHTITERQDKDLIELAKRISRNENLSKYSNQIKNHWSKYRWMIYGWSGPEVPLKAFMENLQEVLAKPELFNEMRIRLGIKKEMLKKQTRLLNSLPVDLTSMSIVLRSIMEAKACRVDAHSLTYYLADPLLKEISKRLGLSLNQLRVMDPPRVRTLFKGFNIDEINQELKYVAYWFEPKIGIRKLIGAKARSKMKQVIEGLPKVKEATRISGELAYPGKVKGKVKIVLSAKEIDIFNKGEILVTGMTDPGFVPAMKKAKAIVTNTGGITCHAAIISREFHIPCVIGTKIATKVFKDGDLIEVDAIKGVVKKIK